MSDSDQLLTKASSVCFSVQSWQDAGANLLQEVNFDFPVKPKEVSMSLIAKDAEEDISGTVGRGLQPFIVLLK